MYLNGHLVSIDLKAPPRVYGPGAVERINEVPSCKPVQQARSSPTSRPDRSRSEDDVRLAIRSSLLLLSLASHVAWMPPDLS
jgi:hypothetical protein